MDFPNAWPVLPVIAAHSDYGYGEVTVPFLTGAAPASATWPSANLAIFVPVALPAPYLVRTLYAYNGTSAVGNADMGVYSLDGSMIVSAGTTGRSGTSTLQIFDVPDTQLMPGRYYLALSCSSTTGQFFRVGTGVAGQQMGGIVQAASQVPLTNLPTFATPANSYVPLIGLASTSTY